ncbi:amino acid adenylation domain-containing protein [Fulvivirgaceae bacterium BMA12]|uniref:Amino acid adenylation domain-containing protein n=1 Tax=Agaribacillus aureus TaxID=3051825 RepID=A0ABT8L7L2_9BACT|nr:amino acid adenylation domain-containing protein [Fulvivirgaceae bacterium BMA12]
MSQIDTSLNTSNLTQSQLLLWTGQKLSPDAPLYNMVLTFDLPGPVDAQRFQQAFQHLMRQSDALRTVFVEEGGIPQQKVLPELDYQLEILDWSANAAALENEASWLANRNRVKFDLSHRLFDTVLVKKSEHHWMWYLNQHHLITDAWGVSVLYQKMAELYQGLSSDTLEEISPLPGFQNYVAYEHESRFVDQNEKSDTYWQEVTTKLPPPPGLYGYTGSPSTTGATRVSIDLGKDRSDRLRQLTKEKDLRSWTQHLSLFNIFASVLFAYLHRVSTQTKLAIGTPTHNRTTTDFKETPGVFIEVLPLVAEVWQEDTFSTLLERVRTEVNEFMMNARAGTATPALGQGFNVILNYIHATFGDFGDIPVNAEWLHPGHVDPRHHMRLQVYDFTTDGSIQLHFDLNHEVFDRSLLEKVPKHFLKILDAFIEDRFQPIVRIGLPDQEEQHQLMATLDAGKTTDHDQTTVVELFRKQAIESPDAIAVCYQGTSLSYRDLDEKSNQLAQYLGKRGISPGKRLIIYLPRTPEFLISVLGILKAGGTFIPIAADNPDHRVQQILESANPTMILTNSALAKNLGNSKVSLLSLDLDKEEIFSENADKPDVAPAPRDLAYIMYTSGSTGNPKGVMISHGALAHYVQWAKTKYVNEELPVFPLFTSVGFDLTITSVFVPLISRGHLVVFRDSDAGPDLSLLNVIEDKTINTIKLTPAHLALLRDKDLATSSLKTVIVGGEDLKLELAKAIAGAFGSTIRVFNEYGPTEATVGCVVHELDVSRDVQTSVPIGKPIPNMQALVLDAGQNQVPQGVPGELYLSGKGLANGYWEDKKLTEDRFIDHKFEAGSLMYRTGDMARMNKDGELEFLGRIDHQVKIGGIRVEPGEIESALNAHPDIQDCVVALQTHPGAIESGEISHCVRCGLPSNYPNVAFDETGTCELCLSFDSYQEKAKKYFKTTEDLGNLFTETKEQEKKNYDCMMLLSGGKDSTYALAQLVDMGAKVLAYTLDNGYISEEAKANIERVAAHLGVDHMYGTTPAMNAIFVDSLKRHSNVCNGCFKTLYTLSTKVALEKGIPFIVTGLSRGQFFETRLTEELFWKKDIDIQRIDDIILNVRKAYHRVDDAVNKLLDTSVFAGDEVFEKVQFIDFYRYTNVSMDVMMNYLQQHLPWIRPSDTGRSTNCLINQVGIYVHKKEQGYSNYAFPYSWDVRLGHKTREGALDEINEEIDSQEVHRIMREIGYTETAENHTRDKKHLVAFYKASSGITQSALKAHLSRHVPPYMIPTYFKQLENLPLSANGKIDRKALPDLNIEQPTVEVPYVAPETEIEEILAGIWAEVLQISQVGVNDNFLDLGGNSLGAIRIIARIEETLKLALPVNCIFEKPTISELAAHVESTITAMMDAYREQQ